MMHLLYLCIKFRSYQAVPSGLFFAIIYQYTTDILAIPSEVTLQLGKLTGPI